MLNIYDEYTRICTTSNNYKRLIKHKDNIYLFTDNGTGFHIIHPTDKIEKVSFKNASIATHLCVTNSGYVHLITNMKRAEFTQVYSFNIATKSMRNCFVENIEIFSVTSPFVSFNDRIYKMYNGRIYELDMETYGVTIHGFANILKNDDYYCDICHDGGNVLYFISINDTTNVLSIYMFDVKTGVFQYLSGHAIIESLIVGDSMYNMYYDDGKIYIYINNIGFAGIIYNVSMNSWSYHNVARSLNNNSNMVKRGNYIYCTGMTPDNLNILARFNNPEKFIKNLYNNKNYQDISIVGLQDNDDEY